MVLQSILGKYTSFIAVIRNPTHSTTWKSREESDEDMKMEEGLKASLFHTYHPYEWHINSMFF